MLKTAIPPGGLCSQYLVTADYSLHCLSALVQLKWPIRLFSWSLETEFLPLCKWENWIVSSHVSLVLKKLVYRKPWWNLGKNVGQRQLLESLISVFPEVSAASLTSGDADVWRAYRLNSTSSENKNTKITPPKQNKNFMTFWLNYFNFTLCFDWATLNCTFITWNWEFLNC